MNHTPFPWRIGKTPGSIVADTPVPGMRGSDDVHHYGCHLVAESVAPQNQFLIAVAPALLRFVDAFATAPLSTEGLRGDWPDTTMDTIINDARDLVAKATARGVDQAVYSFQAEAQKVCQAIGSDVGTMTVACALKEAYDAGRQQRETQFFDKPTERDSHPGKETVT